MTKGLTLWNEFVPALLTELRALPQDELDRSWSSDSERTKVYLGSGRTRGILPGVADRLRMKSMQEFMRFDIHFTDDRGFPQIFVEVENNAGSIADSELVKLCYIRAPLKLIIAVRKWPDAVLTDRWLGDIADCARNWLPEPEVVYGFIIGEARKAGSRTGLYYHFLAVDSDGSQVDERRDEFVNGFSPER
jgi:hypothetical protein